MSVRVHALTPADRMAMDAMRPVLAAGKGHIERVAFAEAMEQTIDAPGISYESASMAGIAGVWCRPAVSKSETVILYVHGGAYIAGTATAFRHQAGHLAGRSGLAAFIPDYRLAPEHPFPAAFADVRAVYDALLSEVPRVLVAGDSAGGGLALVLHATTATTACAVMSPWTDLALTGETMTSRADADPLLTRASLAEAAAQYLSGHDALDPQVSPLYGDLTRLRSTMIHVGDAEILLDDSRRYYDFARSAGAAVTLDIWEGMPHVFESNVGKFEAADAAIEAISTFLRLHAT